MARSAVVAKLLSILSGSPDVTSANFELAARSLTREQLKFVVASGAGVITAATALVETPVGKVRQRSRLIGAVLAPSAGITGTATNFATMIVRKRTNALPGTGVTVLTMAFDTPTTDDMTAWKANDIYAGGVLSATSTDLNFATDDVLTLEITKTASGLSIPISETYFIFEPTDA